MITNFSSTSFENKKLPGTSASLLNAQIPSAAQTAFGVPNFSMSSTSSVPYLSTKAMHSFRLDSGKITHTFSNAAVIAASDLLFSTTLRT